MTDAARAFAAGDEAGALELVIEQWRVTRSTEIAAVAEALSARLEPHVPAIDGKLEDFQPLWLAIAKQQRAVDLPRLMSSVMHGSKRFGVAVVNALVERGAALAAWPADPRTSGVIAELLARPGYETTSKSTYPFWTAMFQILETTGDPRVLPKLQQIKFAHVFRHITDKAKRIAWFQAQLDGVIERFPSTKPVRINTGKLAKLVAAKRAVPAELIAKLADRPVIEAPRPRAPAPRVKLDAKAARTPVDAALRALKAGDEPAALRALVEAWRATRSARIAELVERVSARHDGRLPRIEATSRREIQKLWLDTCREQRVEDLPRLVSSIARTMGRSTDALERVNALASWPSDPRTTAAALRVLEQPPFYTGSTRPFWKALIQLVVDHQDPRAAEQLDALAKRFNLRSTYQDLSTTNAWFKNQLKTAANALRDRVPAPSELDSATAKACDAIAAFLETEDALLAEIYANPADDQLRQVYADLLQQRGDPRGELIVLQLAGDTERAAELLRRYARTWVGPLAPVLYLDQCTFERGFLARARLYDDTTKDDLAPLVGDPAWSTGTHVDLADMGWCPDELLDHPVLANAEVSGAAARRRRPRPAGTGRARSAPR